jgi:hypothetical protein
VKHFCVLLFVCLYILRLYVMLRSSLPSSFADAAVAACSPVSPAVVVRSPAAAIAMLATHHLHCTRTRAHIHTLRRAALNA